MKIVFAADHRGYALKEELKKHFAGKGYEIEDVGALTPDEEDDYTDFAYPAAVGVAANPTGSRGIFLCGSGVGMDVVANKVKGIRATVGYSRESVAHARAHNDVNVITLAGDMLSVPEAVDIAETFLKTDFSNEARHARRLRKLAEIEERNFSKGNG